ncbi:MAG TPA: acetolactate synthase AlsS [Reyranella sp.]|nr:acetolactate synthase AlsS [Reyranella sp.]
MSEVAAEAFRAAESGRPGAAFVSLPQDIMLGDGSAQVLMPCAPASLGPADAGAVAAAVELIDKAERPVLLLGLLASEPRTAQELRTLLTKTRIAVAGTYQAAGIVTKALLDCFGGRVGLFHNQVADILLDTADLVVTVGYDPVEYDPGLWNRGRSRKLVHIDCERPAIDRDYRPTLELTGDLAATLRAIGERLAPRSALAAGQAKLIAEFKRDAAALAADAATRNGMPVHPTRLLLELQALLDQDATICSDIGSFHIWMARHLVTHRPRQMLFSNGQQTLGVGLPWAIGASLAQPGRTIVSVSGDGGFLFSAVELETAVRLKADFVHLVWIDGSYNMVGIQQVAAFGREAAVRFGPVDVVKFAESMGARGFVIRSPDEIGPVMRKAIETPGPVLVGVAVDYSDNPGLMAALHPDAVN